MKLYIIGNGFDRAHGLKTSYWDFRNYLNTYAEEFLAEFERLYGFYPMSLDDYHVPSNRQRQIEKQREEELYSLLWRSFEISLGQPAEEEIQTTCESAVDSMSDIEYGGIEDTLYRFMIKNQVGGFTWNFITFPKLMLVHMKTLIIM